MKSFMVQFDTHRYCMYENKKVRGDYKSCIKGTFSVGILQIKW